MKKTNLSFCFLFFIVCLLFLPAMGCGVLFIPPQEVAAQLLALLQGICTESVSQDVIEYLRLPRFILAVLLGSGLAVCGTVMQALMRNPLADPYLLGISGGAGMGAVIAIVLRINNIGGYDCVGICAFGGAIAITFLVLIIAKICGRSNTTAVLLAGLTVNALCNAIISFLVSVYADAERIQSINYWLMGSLSNNDYRRIAVLSFVIVLGIAFFIMRRRTLDLMLLGDEVSVTLGHDLSVARRHYILLCAVMVGLMVYNAGLVGFVGLVVPHITRFCVGSGHMRLLPLSALLGALFVVWADVASRLIIPGREIAIGVMTACFGAPVFMYFLFSKGHGYGH